MRRRLRRDLVPVLFRAGRPDTVIVAPGFVAPQSFARSQVGSVAMRDEWNIVTALVAPGFVAPGTFARSQVAAVAMRERDT